MWRGISYIQEVTGSSGLKGRGMMFNSVSLEFVSTSVYCYNCAYTKFILSPFYVMRKQNSLISCVATFNTKWQ